jgi:raffinose/stachyose/melibiose transport system substrate-binding protein
MREARQLTVSRRALLRLIGLGSVGTLLAACGSQAQPAAPAKPAEGKPAESKPAAPAAETKPAAAPAAKKLGGAISFWTMETAIEEEKKVLQDGAEEFRQQTGATVNI